MPNFTIVNKKIEVTDRIEDITIFHDFQFYEEKEKNDSMNEDDSNDLVPLIFEGSLTNV